MALEKIGHLFYAISNCVHYFKTMDELIWVKIRRFFYPCDLEICRMPSKSMENLFYATASFMHHFYFVAIFEFKLELQSQNDQIGGKICFDLCDRAL